MKQNFETRLTDKIKVQLSHHIVNIPENEILRFKASKSHKYKEFLISRDMFLSL